MPDDRSVSLVEFEIYGDVPVIIMRLEWSKETRLIAPSLPTHHHTAYVAVPPQHKWYGRNTQDLCEVISGAEITWASDEFYFDDPRVEMLKHMNAWFVGIDYAIIGAMILAVTPHTRWILSEMTFII